MWIISKVFIEFVTILIQFHDLVFWPWGMWVLGSLKSESRSVVSASLWPHGQYSPWNSPGQNTGMSSLSLLQGIFPIQGSNSGLPHCRQILYQLNHKGSPRTLECIAFPFSRGSSRPRNRPGVSCIVGRFFTNWAMRQQGIKPTPSALEGEVSQPLDCQGSPNSDFNQSDPKEMEQKWPLVIGQCMKPD